MLPSLLLACESLLCQVALPLDARHNGKILRGLPTRSPSLVNGMSCHLTWTKTVQCLLRFPQDYRFVVGTVPSQSDCKKVALGFVACLQSEVMRICCIHLKQIFSCCAEMLCLPTQGHGAGAATP